MRPISRLVLASATFVAAASVVLPSTASAHADADVVAVAAGEQVTISFRPNHGCGESPTTEIAVRAPISGVIGEEVEGWTSSSATDGEGRTVVEWKGGSLPVDVTGEFPITFTAPDDVGTLLLFPAVQICENGEEYAWIDGDPESDTPAPRLLILAPGSDTATSVDEVPPDAPGRDQLTAVIDTAPPTSVVATTTTSTTASESPTTDAGETSTSGSPTSTTSSSEAGPDSDNTGSNAVAVVLIGGVAVVLVGGGFYLWRRER